MDSWDAMFKAGHKVTDSVVLERLVGEGAMGSVWVAHHAGLDTRVAVKFIARDHREEAHDKMLRRFEREAKAAAKIKSPHVVHMYDHGVMEGGTPYIVMELLEGETLGARLREVGALDIDTLSEVVTQVGKALAAAHAHGVVHRDIKPDNIFLVPSHGELLVKVLDFGIAKHVEEEHSMTTTGAMLGTPLYMSPELIRRSRDATPAADLWALAVVAYESLCGVPPFEGETVGALFFAICGDPIVAPSQRRKGVPASLDAWFAKALCQEPGVRFGEARNMAQAFVDAAASTEALAAPDIAEAADADPAMGTAEFVSQQHLGVESDAAEAETETEAKTKTKTKADDAEQETASSTSPDPLPHTQTLADAETPKRWPWLAAGGIAAAIAAFALWSPEATVAEVAAPPPAPAAETTTQRLTLACEPVCDSVSVDGRIHRRVDFAAIAEQHGIEPHDDELRIAVMPGEHSVELARDGYATHRAKIVVGEQPVREVLALERSVGTLPAGVVQRLVAQAKPLFDACHQTALTRGAVYGKLDVRFVVGLEGKVVEVAVDGDIRDPALRDCVGSSFKSLSFPAPEGGFVEATHQLAFAPAKAKPAPKKLKRPEGFDNYVTPRTPPVAQQSAPPEPIPQQELKKK